MSYTFRNRRLSDRSLTTSVPVSNSVFRTAVHHHILRKSKVLDGVSSTTGIWDAQEGPVPEVFDINLDRLDLADSLLRRGSSLKDANKVATNTVTTDTAE